MTDSCCHRARNGAVDSVYERNGTLPQVVLHSSTTHLHGAQGVVEWHYKRSGTARLICTSRIKVRQTDSHVVRQHEKAR